MTEITDEILFSVQKLVRLLGEHKPTPTMHDLKLLLGSESSFLMLARSPAEDSPIVGMFSLTIYRVPTGGRSILEDLVVDSGFRNLGVAKAMVSAAIDIARESGADVLTLSSNPNRVEANQLYTTMGFSKRETNSFIYFLK